MLILMFCIPILLVMWYVFRWGLFIIIGLWILIAWGISVDEKEEEKRTGNKKNKNKTQLQQDTRNLDEEWNNYLASEIINKDWEERYGKRK